MLWAKFFTENSTEHSKNPMFFIGIVALDMHLSVLTAQSTQTGGMAKPDNQCMFASPSVYVCVCAHTSTASEYL